MKKCHRCLIDTGALVREAITKQLKQIPKSDKAAASVVKDRLSVCRSCSHLMGATCSACGFFAETRAAHRESECPTGKW